MKRTGEDFAKAAAERGIDKWPIRECSICGYPLAYMFGPDGAVGFDTGCWCARNPRGVEAREWDDVAEHYNMQSHPEVIARYDAFWGFDVGTTPDDHREGSQ